MRFAKGERLDFRRLPGENQMNRIHPISSKRPGDGKSPRKGTRISNSETAPVPHSIFWRTSATCSTRSAGAVEGRSGWPGS